MKYIVVLLLLFLFTACKKEKIDYQSKNESVAVSETEEKTPDTEKISISKDEQLKKMNDGIITVLKSKTYTEFSKFIHPEKGIRLSMYGYLNPKNKVFTKANFQRYINSNIKFTFGEKDGSGELYVTTLKNYFDHWIYKRDFSKSQFYLNEFKGTGNSINNLKTIYPNLDFTENYIAGTEKYGGMDWNALRFVFEELNGNYYLVAIINDEWTI